MNKRWWMTICGAVLAAGPLMLNAQDTFGVPRQAPQPSYPQPPNNPAQQPDAPSAPAAGRGMDLDQLAKMERQDFGVAASAQLHDGAMHGPTPSSIPGGQVVTTKGLVSLVQGRQVPYFLVDVLGGQEMLPGALMGVWMAQPGNFNDQVQQQVVQAMQNGTQGRKDAVVVFYCLSNNCWMSYNAALRAIKAGYTNVLWYRGGVEAWKAAGLPTQAPQQGGYP